VGVIINSNIIFTHGSWVLVAHIYNPGYSGGRDQEDRGSKPAQANSSLDPILKISNTKKGWQSGSSDRVLPSKLENLCFKP
jgi:hypothetical protein